MRVLPILLLAVAGSTAIAALSAQQDPQNPTPRQPANQEPPAKAAPGATATQGDGFLATWILVGTNNEIALAQLAQQKAQDPEVKQFAQKMVEDHQRLAQKLQSFGTAAGAAIGAQDRPGDTPVAGEKPGTQQEKPAGQPQEASAPKQPAAGDLNYVALIQELGKQCLDSSRKELEQKQGAEFDRCYMAMAVGAHMHANDALTVFQRHASGQLKTAISEAQKVVATHLEHAKRLSKKLESGAMKPAEAKEGK